MQEEAAPAPADGGPSIYDEARGIRIQKAMAEAGVASRRECEALIEEGRVTVNGERVKRLPAWVDPRYDTIEIDGERINRPRMKKSGEIRHAYFMLNKPANVISTTDDPEGRRHVLDLIPASMEGDAAIRARLYPVGRLDAESTGLILLTDDGELAHRLTHPSFEVPKQYSVSVRGRLTEEDLARLKSGLFLADQRRIRREVTRGGDPEKLAKKAAVEDVRILGHETDRARGDRTRLGITLREGQNREIRRLLARLGYKVRRLHRTAIGPLKLKGLASGAWRPLTGREIGDVKKAVGLR